MSLSAVAAGRLGTRTAWGGDQLDPDAGTGFSLGVASFDPTPDSVLLWTRLDDDGPLRAVRYKMVEATDPYSVPTTLDGLDGLVGVAERRGDGTYVADVTGLPKDGTHYWYQFSSGPDVSAVGRTRTALADARRPLRLALTSCHDWQQGWYTLWRDIAGQDLDAVVFVGDYIYEYEAYVTTTDQPRVYPRVHLDEQGRASGETYTLEDYRQRYRLYRSDPDLRAAHRLHPFVVVWDDHEVAGDRWKDGAVNHGDNEDPTLIPYADRAAAGEQAYFEYLPARDVPATGGVYRRLRFGDLADLIMLDSRSFRSEGVGGTNRNFNPLSNIDEPDISDPERTILGPEQKAWFKDALVDAGSGRWKLIGNQLMVTPLNLAVLPDVVGEIVADASQMEEFGPLPVTYHQDGLPVNTDQWDGYQAERREILQFIRGDAGQRVDDVVFLTGDIHTGWSSEVYVEQGDAPLGTPVAAEFVCPGISSENFNERIGMIAFNRPLWHGMTNQAAPAAIAMNRHVRYVDFDSNGYVLVEVTPERVRGAHRVLVNPSGAAPDVNPIENRAAIAEYALGGAWQVARGSSRILPAIG